MVQAALEEVYNVCSKKEISVIPVFSKQTLILLRFWRDLWGSSQYFCLQRVYFDQKMCAAYEMTICEDIWQLRFCTHKTSENQMYGFHGNCNLATVCFTVFTTANTVTTIVKCLWLSVFSSHCLQYFSEKLSLGTLTLDFFSLLILNNTGQLEKTTSKTEWEA